MATKTVSQNEITKKVSDGMMELFESVAKKRSAVYEKKGIVYKPEDVPKLISKCGNANALISGGAGLVPGPWGMLAAVPEILLIIKNQIELIYDVGRAYGNSEAQLTPELLVGIFASASGSAGVGLLTIQGGKILVKRTSLRVLQKIVAMLGGKVTQKLLKSMVAKWLPGVGAAAMATWSKVSTNMIGNKAKTLFSQNEVVVDEKVLALEKIPEIMDKSDVHDSLDVLQEKLLVLMNIMKIDGDLADAEKSFILGIIEDAAFDEIQTDVLLSKIDSKEKDKIDTELLIQNDEAMNVMIDAVALAKVDGEIHSFERVYLKQIGKRLGFDSNDIEEMLEA